MYMCKRSTPLPATTLSSKNLDHLRKADQLQDKLLKVEMKFAPFFCRPCACACIRGVWAGWAPSLGLRCSNAVMTENKLRKSDPYTREPSSALPALVWTAVDAMCLRTLLRKQPTKLEPEAESGKKGPAGSGKPGKGKPNKAAGGKAKAKGKTRK